MGAQEIKTKANMAEMKAGAVDFTEALEVSKKKDRKKKIEEE